MRTGFLVIAAIAVVIGIIMGINAGTEARIGIALTLITSAAIVIGLVATWGSRRNRG